MTKRLYDFNHWPKKRQLNNYYCDAYLSSLLASGAMTVYPNTDGTQYALNQPFIDGAGGREGGWYRLLSGRAMNSNSIRNGLLAGAGATPCTTEWCLQSSEGGTPYSQNDPVPTANELTFDFTCSQVVRNYNDVSSGGGRSTGFYYKADRQNHGIDFYFTTSSSLRIQFDNVDPGTPWAGQKTWDHPNFFSGVSLYAVVSLSVVAGYWKIYRNWELYAEGQSVGLQYYSPSGAQAEFVGGGRSSHWAFWDYAVSPGEAAALRAGWERNFLGYSP